MPAVYSFIQQPFPAVSFPEAPKMITNRITPPYV